LTYQPSTRFVLNSLARIKQYKDFWTIELTNKMLDLMARWVKPLMISHVLTKWEEPEKVIPGRVFLDVCASDNL